MTGTRGTRTSVGPIGGRGIARAPRLVRRPGAEPGDTGALRVVVALIAVYLVWGSTYLAIKVALEAFPPMLMASVRFLLAGGALYAWSIRRGDRAGDRPGMAQWRAAFVVGGLLVVGGTGLVIWAVQHLDSGTAALLGATVPLWMGVAAWVLRGERLAMTGFLGIAVGLLGVGLLVRPQPGQALHLGAAVAVVGGAALWAYGSLHPRRAALPARPLVATSMEMLAGAALFALLGVASGELGRLSVAAVTPRSALALLYLVVFGSVVAFSAYVWLLRTSRTAMVSTYAYVNPAVAVLLGWAILGEAVTASTLGAGGLVVVSVALMVRARPGRPLPAQATSGADAVTAQRRPRRARR